MSEADQSETGASGATLTPADAAALLGVNERTVRRWIAAGRLPATDLGGRYVIEPAALAALTKERTTKRAAGMTGAAPQEQAASSAKESEPAASEPQPGAVLDLVPLVELVRQQQADLLRYAEQATAWQIRAITAEEKLKAIEASVSSAELIEHPNDGSRPIRDMEHAAKPEPPAPVAPPVRRSFWRRLFTGEG